MTARDVPPMPAGLELPAQEQRIRARMLGEGGPLAAALRSIEAREWHTPGWLGDLWLWVMFLVVSRGFRAATTVADYVEVLGRFGGWLEQRGSEYGQLRMADFAAWQRWLYAERRLSVSSRRQSLMAVKSFYSWRAMERGVADPTKDVRAPKVVVTTAKKYTGMQLRALFAAARDDEALPALRNTTMLLVLLAAGLRREELSTLRVDQLELTSERRAVVHVLGKGAKERNIPIEGPVVQHLMRWLDARRDVRDLHTDALFVSLTTGLGRGGPVGVRSIEALIERVAKRAKLPSWGVHRFRVTFATQMYDDGVDIERIRVLMGHETIETTRRYLAVSNRMNRHSLKAHRQHAALGTAPDGMPLWAQELERSKHGTGILPPR